ncbi:MAG: hypothetical protein K6C69_00165 [Lachnospiraceae bacterium]|nr:hypothetical protein [Lachnospiraceae bacterium]
MEVQKAFVSLVTYIQEDSLETLHHFMKKILKPLAESFEHSELIFVLDGHGVIDGTAITKLMDEEKIQITAEVVSLPYYQGIEAAMCAGDDLSIGDFVFEFDEIHVDYDLSVVEEVYQKARSGYDVVSAGDDSMEWGSRVFYWLMNHRSAYEIRHESFRIVSRRALNRIKILHNTVAYRKLLYASSGLPTAYVRYEKKETVAKRKKRSYNEKKYRRDAAMCYMMIFTEIMEKFTAVLSAAFLLVTVGTGIWALYDYLHQSSVESGWISLMGVISFGFFGVFLLISIMIKYMTILVDANYKKASYVVEGVERINRGSYEEEA